MTHKENSVTARTARRSITLGLAVGLAGGMLLGPVSPVHATTTEAQMCSVDSAELRWGVKERFRNYISGSIANGEWTTANGASYESPTFVWANGTGEISSDLEDGAVDFTGDVHFTGHGGLMKLDLQNPSIVFTGPDSAQLVAAMGSVDTEGSEVALERVVAAVADFSGAEIGDGTSYTIENAPVRLTSEGAAAFNGEYGDYVAGDTMDGLALSLTVSGCTIGADTGTAPAPVEEEEVVSQEPAPAPVAASIPWLPIAIGGIALIAIGVTSGMLLAGRKKNQADAQQDAPDAGGDS